MVSPQANQIRSTQRLRAPLSRAQKDERNRRRREQRAVKKQLKIGETSSHSHIDETINKRKKRNERQRVLYAQHKAAANEKNSHPSAATTTPHVHRPPSVFEIGSTSTPGALFVGGNVTIPPARKKNKSSSHNFVISEEPFMLPEVPHCCFCGAKRFHLETTNFCCLGGRIMLARNDVPEALSALYLGKNDLAIGFRKIVRSYNNSFAFTSLGVKCDQQLCRRNNGVYTFRVQGQIYHFMNSLTPSDDHATCLQLYFYDTEHEITNRIKSCDRLDPEVVQILINVMSQNPYSIFFRNLHYIGNLDKHTIMLKTDGGLDQRVFNAPQASQIAAIWCGDDADIQSTERDIIVHLNAGTSVKIKHYYGCYDPLQYPLLFPFGDTGWHQGILRLDRPKSNVCCQGQSLIAPLNASSGPDLLSKEEEVFSMKKKTREAVSCREYYCYKLQIRYPSDSILLHSGRLFQQFVVDMYIKIETSRLDYYRNKQSEIRADLYQGIIDSVVSGECRGSQVGRRLILPASFIGGPRDMRKRYIDAMTLVQRYGKPDIFLTMTCNPLWPEIKSQLLSVEEAQNRPDLIARVFRSKLEHLKSDLLQKQLFGPIQAYAYVVEFQKRGLPHCHFLIILQDGHKLNSTDLYDRFVCAELPLQNQQSHLYSMVVRHMMHGPCGSLNPTNVCMKHGHCKNQYPKAYSESTTISSDAYPIYRRRNDGAQAKVRGHKLDNRWVVPYNPYLLAKFNCHINVEVCSTIQAVKYLYKYIYKGHDKIIFQVVDENLVELVDEIQQFQSARWVSPPEAMWRIYKFILSDMHPSVLQLQLHVENCQTVCYHVGSNLETVAHNDQFSRTMLTEFFRMNLENDHVCNEGYLYREFPEHFVWVKQDKIWVKRKRGETIGRIVTANPAEGERYYLRLLLNHIRAPTSYCDLKTVYGVQFSSFRESALSRGLLQADNYLQECLTEGANYQMPLSLRKLFATVLVYCAPDAPSELWLKFAAPMSEDYTLHSHLSSINAKQKALVDIENVLQSMGKSLGHFGLDIFLHSKFVCTNPCKEIEDELAIPVTEYDLQSLLLLNSAQRYAFQIITDKVFSNEPGCFFIDGPGGTGKTFLYKSILAAVRSKNIIALATASSGVAASILPGGRTAHSRFKIPVDVSNTIVCNVSKQTQLAHLLRASKLIIWDEAPMTRRQAIEAVNLMLQDINDSPLLFGGKVMVFGGDFRQVLPVVPKGSKMDCINASLAKSPIWNSLKKIQLTENMRAQHDPSFCQYLLRVGDGLEPTIFEDEIQIPSNMLILGHDIDDSLSELIHFVFPELNYHTSIVTSMVQRAILTPKNEDVDTINELLMKKFPGEPYHYVSIDEAVDYTQQAQYEDFLNSLCPSGLPPHVLTLKKNCPVMLLRNIDPPQGLSNGTRLLCLDFQRHVISAEIAVGDHKGKHVLLPRIPLQPSDKEKFPIPFTRKQFPIRLCFAMTINKAQGQTLDTVGIYLPQPVFSHGQLYVALSRAKTSTAVKILIQCREHDNGVKTTTKNVVYKDLLRITNSI